MISKVGDVKETKLRVRVDMDLEPLAVGAEREGGLAGRGIRG